MKSPKSFKRTDLDNDLLKTLLALRQGKPDTVPAGHLTTEQWGEKWKISKHVANDLIRMAIKAKLMGSKKYRIKAGQREGLFPIAHYFEL